MYKANLESRISWDNYLFQIDGKNIAIPQEEIEVALCEKWYFKAQVRNIHLATWTWKDSEQALEQLNEVLTAFNGWILKLIENGDTYLIEQM